MGGASRFNEIERCLPNVSRSLLIQRLRLLARRRQAVVMTPSALEVFWLVVQPDEASLCTKDPGLEVDVYVKADSLELQRVFSGRITLDTALSEGTINLNGPTKLVRSFGDWFLWSPFYESTRAKLTAAPV